MLRQLFLIVLLLVGSLTFERDASFMIKAFSPDPITQHTSGMDSMETGDESVDYDQTRNTPYISIQYCTS
jgi:hypothetical protein